MTKVLDTPEHRHLLHQGNKIKGIVPRYKALASF